MTRMLTEKVSTNSGQQVWSDIDQNLEGELLRLQMTIDSISLYEGRQRTATEPGHASSSRVYSQTDPKSIMIGQLNSAQQLLELCNTTFATVQNIYDPSRIDRRSFTQLASDTMSMYCYDEHERHWQDVTNALAEKSAMLKKESRELLLSNLYYCRAATSLKVELDEYAGRLDARGELLKKGYLRYCEIMQELGTEVSTLGSAHDELLAAQNVHAAAWEAREVAAAVAEKVAREIVA
jgi:hypothetical protein